MKSEEWRPRTCTKCGKAPVERKGFRRCFGCRHPGAPQPTCRICGSAEFFYNDYCRLCHWSSSDPRSCLQCFAYGHFEGYTCSACYALSRKNRWAICPGCGRRLPVAASGFCRLCLHEARTLVRRANYKSRLIGFVDEVARGQQLFFADMTRSLRLKVSGASSRRHRMADASAGERPHRWPTEQLMLIDPVRDIARWDQATEDQSGPHLVLALQIAERFRERWSWEESHYYKIRRGLTMLLSGQPPHRRVTYTEALPLAKRQISVERVVAVLDEIGLFHDDRADPLDEWILAKINDLPEQMGDEVMIWSAVLRGHRGRSRPQARTTVKAKIYEARPALLEWAAQGHSSLREITRATVDEFLATQHGFSRRNQVYALRSMFGHLHRQRVIFGNPTAGLKAANLQRDGPVPPPLREEDLAAVAAAAVDPERRLLFVLAAVQGMRPIQMRALQLDDVHLAGRTLVVGTHPRPVGDVTADALEGWLRLRRSRWPACANPHLLVSKQTAYEVGPVSAYWLKSRFFGLTATLERLRVDRQLEELMVQGPDPLHFSAMFGTVAGTGVRYARAAAAMLGVDVGKTLEVADER